jgi:hypothetical protein
MVRARPFWSWLPTIFSILLNFAGTQRPYPVVERWRS